MFSTHASTYVQILSVALLDCWSTFAIIMFMLYDNKLDILLSVSFPLQPKKNEVRVQTKCRLAPHKLRLQMTGTNVTAKVDIRKNQGNHAWRVDWLSCRQDSTRRGSRKSEASCVRASPTWPLQQTVRAHLRPMATTPKPIGLPHRRESRKSEANCGARAFLTVTPLRRRLTA